MNLTNDLSPGDRTLVAIGAILLISATVWLIASYHAWKSNPDSFPWLKELRSKFLPPKEPEEK